VLAALTVLRHLREELVQRALVHDDPAALLTPLADAHTHLDGDHAGLAGRIRSVTDQVEQLRRDAVERRANGVPPED